MKVTRSFSLEKSVVKTIEEQAEKQGLSKSEVVNEAVAAKFALEMYVINIQRKALELNEAIQLFTEAGM